VEGKVPEVFTRGGVTSPKRVELAEEPPPLNKNLVVGDLGYKWTMGYFDKKVEDVAELGRRVKQMDAAANITAQVTTSRPENLERIERNLARVKMRMVDTVLKVMVVVEMYEKANTGGQVVLSRTQLELEVVLSRTQLELEVVL
jgi:hypothetical protein